MSGDRDPPQGAFAALRRLAATLLAAGRTRLSLASVELTEERDRLLRIALLALASAFALMLALVALSALLVVAFWDSARIAVLAALLAVYLLVGLWCALRARALARAAPALLEGTLAELERDARALGRDD